jgi:hypothetical protein
VAPASDGPAKPTPVHGELPFRLQLAVQTMGVAQDVTSEVIFLFRENLFDLLLDRRLAFFQFFQLPVLRIAQGFD